MLDSSRASKKSSPNRTLTQCTSLDTCVHVNRVCVSVWWGKGTLRIRSTLRPPEVSSPKLAREDLSLIASPKSSREELSLHPRSGSADEGKDVDAERRNHNQVTRYATSAVNPKRERLFSITRSDAAVSSGGNFATSGRRRPSCLRVLKKFCKCLSGLSDRRESVLGECPFWKKR